MKIQFSTKFPIIWELFYYTEAYSLLISPGSLHG